MDSEANLQQQLLLANRILKDAEEGLWLDEQKAERLAELVHELHTWICNGGALPTSWRRP